MQLKIFSLTTLVVSAWLATPAQAQNPDHVRQLRLTNGLALSQPSANIDMLRSLSQIPISATQGRDRDDATIQMPILATQDFDQSGVGRPDQTQSGATRGPGEVDQSGVGRPAQAQSGGTRSSSVDVDQSGVGRPAQTQSGGTPLRETPDIQPTGL